MSNYTRTDSIAKISVYNSLSVNKIIIWSKFEPPTLFHSKPHSTSRLAKFDTKVETVDHLLLDYNVIIAYIDEMLG